MLPRSARSSTPVHSPDHGQNAGYCTGVDLNVVLRSEDCAQPEETDGVAFQYRHTYDGSGQ